MCEERHIRYYRGSVMKSRHWERAWTQKMQMGAPFASTLYVAGMVSKDASGLVPRRSLVSGANLLLLIVLFWLRLRCFGRGVVAVDQGEGGDGFDHGGKNPGDDHRVLVLLNRPHPGEDENVHDECLEDQEDRRYHNRRSVPVGSRAWFRCLVGGLEAGVRKQPDADSEEDRSQGDGEEDG